MIKISNLKKVFDNGKVLYDNFNLDIKDNEITVILGESGTGKSTLLNCIAGLTKYEGNITNVTSSYVFQEPILLPNLTVKENLLLVNQNEEKISEILYKIELSHKLNSYPKDLSYGQACRVSLARALLYESDAILLDEPLSNLDLRLKNEIIEEFKELLKNKTVIYVTHDIDEALNIANRIIVLGKNTILLDLENTQTKYGEESKNRKVIVDTLLTK